MKAKSLHWSRNMKKLFVLTRCDLSGSQQAVQAGHAVAEFLLHVQQSEYDWDNGTLIYLGVDSEDDLEYWGDILNRKEIQWIAFKEPDRNNEITAIAAVCDDKVFKKLRLLNLAAA